MTKTLKVQRVTQPHTVGTAADPAKRRFRLSTCLLHATLVFFCLVILVPMAWLLLLSVSSLQDSVTGALWPTHFDFSSYGFVFKHFSDLSQFFANTLVVTVATVVLTTFCAVLAGYALVHLCLPGRGVFLALMVATLFLPERVVSLIAIFEIDSNLHLLNTPLGLILPYVALNLVVSTFIMRGVFQNISPEIVDAARMDGSSSWRTLWAVLLPLSANGIIVVVITNFVIAWGEYLLALTLAMEQSGWTMMVAIFSGLGGMGAFYRPQVAALYLLFILPGIAVFALLQRWFLGGLSESARNVG